MVCSDVAHETSQFLGVSMVVLSSAKFVPATFVGHDKCGPI